MKRVINEALDMLVVSLFTIMPLLLIAIFLYGLFCIIAPHQACAEYIGRISPNPFYADSCSNPFSKCGNPFDPSSPKNPFGPYGNPFSNYSANNPYATQSPGLYGYADGAAQSESYPEYSDEPEFDYGYGGY